MKNDNPLSNFQTNTYTDFRDKSSKPEVCPNFAQATANPIKMIDYISCHKILMIFVLAIIVLVLYSGAKVKAAADTASGGGTKGGSTGGTGGPAKR